MSGRRVAIHGSDLEDGQTYVEHADPELYPDYFTVASAASTKLPADARDPGYERHGHHLWVAPDHSRAFAGTRDSVAVWPHREAARLCVTT